MGKLEGKVAFITGAARGQGRSHAVRLAQEVEALDRRIVAAKGDVRHREQLQAVLDDGMAQLGNVDIVVVNAGILPGRDDTLCGGFVDATDVDLIGAMNTVAVALPHLQSDASIIVTGSTAGMIKGTTEMMGNTGGIGYAWAKQTIIRYVEVLALQLAPAMIRMNGVHPTNCDTDLLHNDDIYKAFRPDLEHPTREDAIPYIDPLDVSNLVAFLASDESRYITGMNIRVDAGGMLKAPPALGGF
jgi:NAD(P)-dependent dehydrogenase (short-subunit alcohol dehydrogenase family)